MKDSIQVIGTAHLVLCDASGRVIDERYAKNMIVTSGLGYITSRMKENTATVMSHLAVGTNNAVEAKGQATLSTEIGTRVAATITQTLTTYSNDTFQAVGTFAAANATGTLVEAGIFNASSAGTMLNRLVFGAITKGASDSLTITWKIQLS